jgi:hypothetical protein
MRTPRTARSIFQGSGCAHALPPRAPRLCAARRHASSPRHRPPNPSDCEAKTNHCGQITEQSLTLLCVPILQNSSALCINTAVFFFFGCSSDVGAPFLFFGSSLDVGAPSFFPVPTPKYDTMDLLSHAAFFCILSSRVDSRVDPPGCWHPTSVSHGHASASRRTAKEEEVCSRRGARVSESACDLAFRQVTAVSDDPIRAKLGRSISTKWSKMRV